MFIANQCDHLIKISVLCVLHSCCVYIVLVHCIILSIITNWYQSVGYSAWDVWADIHNIFSTG
jgi:hypothetical protein